MLGYIAKVLKRFKHTAPNTPPQYGKHIQYAPLADTGPRLDKQHQKFIQEVIGTFIYYTRAVDGTMLTTLSALTTKQANPTATMMQKTKQFLDYAASNSNTTLTYNASNMVLAVHSDTSYLNKKQAQRRAGGHFFLSSTDVFPITRECSST